MFLKLIIIFLENKFQRVVLNGQTSSWEPVLAGVPQNSVCVPLLFLIYINDLSKNVSSNTKLFTDDVYIFSTVKNVNTSTGQLNSDLEKKNETGPISAKCHLILILRSKLKSCFFLEKE